MRILPLLCVVACVNSPLDPGPRCEWQIEVVDSSTGEVDLLEQEGIACRPAETAPNALMYEAIVLDGVPYVGADLAIACTQEALVTALQVDGIPRDARLHPVDG